METKITKSPDQMTFAEHAEAWWTEQGGVVPPHDSMGWHYMYQAWVNFAFGSFPDSIYQDDTFETLNNGKIVDLRKKDFSVGILEFDADSTVKSKDYYKGLIKTPTGKKEIGLIFQVKY